MFVLGFKAGVLMFYITWNLSHAQISFPPSVSPFYFHYFLPFLPLLLKKLQSRCWNLPLPRRKRRRGGGGFQNADSYTIQVNWAILIVFIYCFVSLKMRVNFWRINATITRLWYTYILFLLSLWEWFCQILFSNQWTRESLD